MNNKLTENLKSLRCQNHFSQNDLAVRLNVSRPTISSWETGRNTPDIETLVRIAHFYQVPVDQLLFTADNSKEALNKSKKHVLSLLIAILAVERITQLSTNSARGWMDFLLLIPVALYFLLIFVNKNWISSRVGLSLYKICLLMFGILGIGSGSIDLFSMGMGFQIPCLACGLIALGYLGKIKFKYLFWRIREITVS